MTTRERWTVYPLLFLAILIAARSELFPSERAKFRAIECQELRVTTVNGESLVHVGESAAQAGVIVVYGPLRREGNVQEQSGDDENGKPSGGQDSAKRAFVRSPVAELGSESAGGVLRLWSTPEIPAVYVGHHAAEHMSGVMAEGKAGRLISSQKQFRGQFWGTQLMWADFEEKTEREQSGGTETESDAD